MDDDSGNQAATARNQEFLQRLFEGSSDGILHTSTDGRILRANRTACEMLGRTEQELQRIGRAGIVDAENPETRALIDDRHRLGSVRRELDLRRGDGSLFPCEVTTAEYGGADGVSYALAILRDITERRRAERSLRESEARFRKVIEVSPVPFVLGDAHGHLVYINPAFESTFGFALEEIPTAVEWWEHAYPDPAYRHYVATSWERRLEESLQNDRPFEHMEVVIRCKDGSDRNVVAFAVGLEGLETVTHLAILFDVTEQRRLERRVMEAAAFERHRLGMDLHDGLGHQLTSLSLLLADLARAAGNREASAVQQELSRLGRMAAECVGSARSIAHGLCPIELGGGGLYQALRRLANSEGLPAGLTVRVELAELAQADIHQSVAEPVYRIVQEALGNAVKHGQAREVLISGRLSKDALMLQVADNGRGLTQGAQSGGFGLNIMRYRAHALGGRVDIESPATGGTIVTCVCPLLASRGAAIIS